MTGVGDVLEGTVGLNCDYGSFQDVPNTCHWTPNLK